MRSAGFRENVVKAIESFRRGDVVADHYPVVGYIEPTTNCNLRCPSCPTGLRAPIRERAFIPLDGFRRLMDVWGDYMHILYMYNKGEPLLHPDFPEMVRMAASREIVVHASSNLNVRMTDETADEIVSGGLALLKIGIDGITQETYGRYRRGGNLELALANVGKLAAAKRKLGAKTPLLKVFFHIFEHNEHEMERAEAFLLEHGVDAVTFTPALLPHDAEAGINPPRINRQFDVKTNYDRCIPPDAETAGCSWLWFAMVHNPNGSVSPCCSVAHEKHDFGRMDAEPDVIAAFNTQRYRAARSLARRSPDVNYRSSMGLVGKAVDDNAGIICEHCPAPFIINNFRPENLFPGILKQLEAVTRHG
ncbi:MAG: radical SAM protein [Nitrospirae bacterium]|nr:radical SAM protein [Nitrospirota bacterium]